MFYLGMIGRLVLSTAALSLIPPALVSQTVPQAATLPTGLPLRIALDHRYPIRIGTQVQGHLTSAVYLVDHVVLPVDTPVYGVVIGCHPVRRMVRLNAMLDGDFTPLAEPQILFERLQLPDGSLLKASAPAIQRSAVVVRMTAASHHTAVVARVKTEFNARRVAAIGQYLSPGKGERLRQAFYQMLPYHPQDMWTGEQFDAELSQAVELPEPLDRPAPLPVVELGRSKPAGVIEARLTENLTSAESPTGMPVKATVTKPLFDQKREHVLVPEGAILSGLVVESRHARLFGRNGRLRFSFRRIEQAENSLPVHGIVVAAEGAPGENLTIDSEGGSRATTPNRTLGTLTLALLAASASHGERENDGGSAIKSGIVSNGFGMMGRLASMATGDKNVASGFAYYALAKNLSRRWIARGKDVTFPRDTRIQIDLAER